MHSQKQVHLNMRYRSLFFMALACSAILLFAAWRVSDRQSMADRSELRIAIRNAGHNTLLLSGDSVSRIEVRSIGRNDFMIDFPGSFTFSTDSLVNSFRQNLSGTEFPSSYTVEVTDLRSGKIIYGFMMAGSADKTVIPCSGRLQPESNYSIRVHFTGQAENTAYYLTFSGLALLLVTGGTYSARRLRSTPRAEIIWTEIGSYQFNQDKKLLVRGRERTPLSDKEARLLALFSEHINRVVERNFLMQKIWEDEGVIVGRSLDVFVSKLRKKLQGDARVRIENVHGIGYKLTID